MLNILIGLVMVVGGASGKLVFRGTDSSIALVILGACLIAWGGFSVWRRRSGGE